MSNNHSDALTASVRFALMGITVPLEVLAMADLLPDGELESILAGERRATPLVALVVRNALGCLASDIESLQQTSTRHSMICLMW